MTIESRYKSLFEAAEKGSVKDVQYFVEVEGVDVNARSPSGRSALHFAAECNSVEVVEYLTDKDAVVDAQSNLGMRPLHYAAKCNSNVVVLECLVTKGADVNAMTRECETPLHFSVDNPKRN